MKEFAACLVAPFVIVLLLTSIVLTLVRDVIGFVRDEIDSVCDVFTEYFSDVLELKKR